MHTVGWHRNIDLLTVWTLPRLLVTFTTMCLSVPDQVARCTVPFTTVSTTELVWQVDGPRFIHVVVQLVEVSFLLEARQGVVQVLYVL